MSENKSEHNFFNIIRKKALLSTIECLTAGNAAKAGWDRTKVYERAADASTMGDSVDRKITVVVSFQK